MGTTSDACWFLLIKTLLIIINNNNKKRETALKDEAGGDEKHVGFFFLTWPYKHINVKVFAPVKHHDSCLVINVKII